VISYTFESVKQLQVWKG